MAEQTIEQLHNEKDTLLNRYTDDMDAVHLALDIDVAELDEHPWVAVEAIRELRSNLTLAQFQFTDACAVRDALAKERDQLKGAWEYSAHLAKKRKDELAQAREELVTADAAMDAVQALWRSPAEAKRQDANLAQARAELKDLQGARHKCERRLVAAKDSRDYWHETSLSAEAERDKMRKEAQAQSDLVQHEWLSPCQKAGLEQKLAEAGAQVASCREATEWLWGFWDGNTLTARLGYGDNIREAWDDLLVATGTRAASKLLERLAILDAAEAALADCGIGGVYDEFDGLADAIEQMAQHIKELASRLAQGHIDLEEKTSTLAAVRRNRDFWMDTCCKAEQRATRAEAPVGLVATEEAAALLERLGRPWYEVPTTRVKDDFTTARKLAAQIREALDDSQA